MADIDAFLALGSSGHDGVPDNRHNVRLIVKRIKQGEAANIPLAEATELVQSVSERSVGICRNAL